MYVQDGSDPKDPYASPMFGKHEDLPPALIQTASSTRCATRARPTPRPCARPRVPVRLTNYVGAVHGYISLPGVVPAAHQALSEAVDWLREVFAPEPTRTRDNPIGDSGISAPPVSAGRVVCGQVCGLDME